jgi:hypothetical protein
MIKAYKGFNKDLQCRGFQFEVGKQYEEPSAKVCERGFHACEYPLDVFNYYPPAESRYCLVELDGDIAKGGDDTKVAATVIRIVEELTMQELIEAAAAYTIGRAKPVKGSTASGTRGAATASGDQGAATASGDQGAATASGTQGAATASGTRGAATVNGNESIACGLGYQCKARGALGCWLVLAERDDAGHILMVKAVLVDGEIIKPNVFYSLNNGEFVEAP